MSHSSETFQKGRTKNQSFFSESCTGVPVDCSIRVQCRPSGPNEKELSSACVNNDGLFHGEQSKLSSIDLGNEHSFRVSHATELDKLVDTLDSSKNQSSDVHRTKGHDVSHSENLGASNLEHEALFKKPSVTRHHGCRQVDEEFEEEKCFSLSSPPSITDLPEESPRPLKFKVSPNSLYRMFTSQIFWKRRSGSQTLPRTPSAAGVANLTKQDAHMPNTTTDNSIVPKPPEPVVKRLPLDDQVQSIVGVDSLRRLHCPPGPLPAGESSCDEDGPWTPLTSPREATVPVEWKGRSGSRTIGSHFSTSSVRSRPRSPRNSRRRVNGGRSRRHISVSPGAHQRIAYPRSRRERDQKGHPLGSPSRNDIN